MVAQWQLPYLGLKSLPEELSAWELDYFFTLSPDELDTVEQRYQGLHRLGAALQLGFLRMTGCTLDAMRLVPPSLLYHLARQLGIGSPTIASLRALYRRQRTRYEHQRWAMQWLGFSAINERQRRVLGTRLRHEARTVADTGALIQFARRWLYDHRLVILAARSLKELTASILAQVEREQYLEVLNVVPEAVCQAWLQQLYTSHPHYQVQLIDWLKTPPAKRSPKHLIEVFDKIAQLKALGVHCYELPLSLERQRYYATRMHRRFPQRFRALAPARRTLELVCFLRMTLMDATDVALALTEKRVAEIWGQARRAAEQHHARTGPEAWTTLRAVHHTLHDPIVLDEELRVALCTLVDPLMRKAPSTRAECTRERLCEERSIRSLLRRLLELDFHAAAGDPILVALEQLRSLYAALTQDLPAEASCPFGPRWLRLLGSSDRKRALRAFEAATLYALRRALRNGTVWVDYSLSYRSRESMLIPREQWMRDRRKYYRALGLPSAKTFLDRLAAQLHAGLLALEEAVVAEEVGIEEEAIHLKRIVREERPDMTRRVGDALFDAVGPIQLPDLVLEVDSHTRFSWLLLGEAPRTEQMLLGVYGALLAQGTELDAARVALMIPELPERAIVASMQLLEEPGALAKANAAVLAPLGRHPIVKHWGSGTFASSDMVSLEVSRHLWSARVDPRRRTHAIGTYVHVLDQWGIFYDQPIVLNERQAGAAIEGAIRPAGIHIEALATDTHGYTDYAMGLAKLLGLDLYPRLRDAKHKKLFVPRGLIAPASLQPVLGPALSLQPVEQHWDELVRLAASVRYGWCSAVMALRRYGAAARGDPLYQAGVILGKLIRSVYLCDYFAQPPFRREVLRILSHGESVHALQRAIHHGRPVAQRGRRPEEWLVQSGALALLTNVTLAWNTHRMEQVIGQWAETHPEWVDPDILRHISPVRHGHINFRGVLRFAVSMHRERLFAPASIRSADSRAAPHS